MMRYGPKGIWDESFFLFFIKSGITLIKATVDEKKITKGIEIQPNQKPITERSLASPNPIPSLFLNYHMKISNIDFVISMDLGTAGPAGFNGAVRCKQRWRRRQYLKNKYCAFRYRYRY